MIKYSRAGVCMTAGGNRSGTTLTEVLMALLVMGLGVVSVATLFPLSVLRSVEATKLTNATTLRRNAEEQIRLTPSFDTGKNPIPRGLVEDPDFDGDSREHDGTKFVLDPLGAATFSSEGTVYDDGSSLATSFGGKDSDANGKLDASLGISRFAFGKAGSVAAAQNFVTLPDSYLTLADVFANAVTVTTTKVTIPSVNFNEYAATAPALPLRVTLLDINGRSSNLRTVSTSANVSGTALTFDNPLTGSTANVGRVIVEIPERRYTWLATVRRLGPKPSVTIVVFFRRALSAEDEKAYTITETAGTYNEYLVPTPRPAGLKVGGFMFDVATFRWFKITAVEDKATPAVFTTDANDIDIVTTARTFTAMFPRNVVETYTLRKD